MMAPLTPVAHDLSNYKVAIRIYLHYSRKILAMAAAVLPAIITRFQNSIIGYYKSTQTDNALQNILQNSGSIVMIAIFKSAYE